MDLWSNEPAERLAAAVDPVVVGHWPRRIGDTAPVRPWPFGMPSSINPFVVSLEPLPAAPHRPAKCASLTNYPQPALLTLNLTDLHWPELPLPRTSQRNRLPLPTHLTHHSRKVLILIRGDEVDSGLDRSLPPELDGGAGAEIVTIIPAPALGW